MSGVRHGSAFQVMMAVARGYRVIRLGEDDFGLYCRGFVNGFGTSLAARGTRDYVDSIVEGRK